METFRKDDLKIIQHEWEKLMSLPEIQALLPRQPNMRYWKKGNVAYCWTTEPVKGKFFAVRYRILKDGSWKLKHKVAFSRRKVAKARAKKWFEEVRNKNGNRNQTN